MRITIKSLQEELARVKKDSNSYKNILDQIEMIVNPKNNYMNGPRTLLSEISQLISYKQFNQGAIRSEVETIHILKEIVRWQVNPETALESKVQENMNNFRN